VLIPKNVIYFYHEDHEGLEDITALTSWVILRRFIKQCFMNFNYASNHLAYRDVGKGREHDCMDAGGRAMPGAIAEERKLSSTNH